MNIDQIISIAELILQAVGVIIAGATLYIAIDRNEKHKQ